MSKLRRIKVSGAEDPTRWTSLSWFPGSSCESIEVATKVALNIPTDAMIRCCDSAGCVVALTEAIPSDTELRIEVVGETVFAPSTAPENQPLLSNQAGGGSMTLSTPDSQSRTDDGFRTQLLKFERINAHLANERTWLAWVRTALSLISCGFTLLNEATNYSNYSWRVIYFVLGSLFLCCVDLTWMTGWFRYRRNKDILSMPKESLPQKFNRFRMRFQAQFLGGLLISTLIVYVASGWRNIQH
mmetsp:Transcript_19605/g.25377  ORF Transcript_19605/g.25377 Transcript_19605/m.25377 type:complete len:243 (-) Transcript_19605:781-1509(-)